MDADSYYYECYTPNYNSDPYLPHDQPNFLHCDGMHADDEYFIASESCYMRDNLCSDGLREGPLYSAYARELVEHSRDFQREDDGYSMTPLYAAYSDVKPRHPTDDQKNQGDENWQNSRPTNTHGISLHPVSSLPDIYRGLFKFGVFNAVQSACYDDVLNSNENMVISAPTGSGKTVIFELAIIRMLDESRRTGVKGKAVYLAPTKALCSERFRDWMAKFDPLGAKCCELTGDTVYYGHSAWSDAKNAIIIITTGEKWDSLTRNWSNYGQNLSQVHLFLVDEVHILNESRGSTLEVVVSRMRKLGSSVRFILVSATVPNIEDIAAWVGSVGDERQPALVKEFGQDYRPCKLKRIVIGVPRPKYQNEFAFSKTLDYKLFGLLRQYSTGRPMLVFCPTRKGVLMTAEQLMTEYIKAQNRRDSLPWSHPSRRDFSFNNKRLTDLALMGIGVHHAGLVMDDRRLTEDLFLRGVLRIVIATSTLAVGVNLPAHMVVIKGVRTFQNNAPAEYSDLDIMQMLGRAGRPQFDKDGIAIIMCEQEVEVKYRALTPGKTVLESSLHINLSEHLTSEIGIGTITDISSAKAWLRGSFLFQRIRKNPCHYSLGKGEYQTWEERIDDLVTRGIIKLREAQLIHTTTSINGEEVLSLTEYGDIMSKLYIKQATMHSLLSLPDRASLREILETISAAEEFSEIKLRTSEKTCLDKLRKHPDIRFEMKKLEKTANKVFLLIQAVLGGISLNSPEYRSPDSQPQLEALSIFHHLTRVAKAAVEVAVHRKLGAQVKHSLELLRCFTAKTWEERPTVLRQIEQIGEKSIKVLAEHSIATFDHLRNQDAVRIETLLNRRPPFGSEVLALLSELPVYHVEVTELSITSRDRDGPIEVELSIRCGLKGNETHGSKLKKRKGFSMTTVLTLTSEMEFVDFRRMPTDMLRVSKTFDIRVQLMKPSQYVLIIIAAETIAGIAVTTAYRPNVPASDYPTLNTRPPALMDLDLEGLENDPDFWNMEVDVGTEDTSPSPVVVQTEKTEAKTDEPNMDLSLNLDENKSTTTQHRKLQNGRFQCNHTCKNKTSCRHLCCREGLRGPPNPRRRNKQASPHRHLREGNTKSDRHLLNLESLHNRANVRNRLQLPKDHRIRLQSNANMLKRKSKAPPDFEIEFADLSYQSISANPYENIGCEILKEDDLPEICDISRCAPTQTCSDARGAPLGRDLAAVLYDKEDKSVPTNGKRTFSRGGEAGQTSKTQRSPKSSTPPGPTSNSLYHTPNLEVDGKGNSIETCLPLPPKEAYFVRQKEQDITTSVAFNAPLAFSPLFLYVPDNEQDVTAMGSEDTEHSRRGGDDAMVSWSKEGQEKSQDGWAQFKTWFTSGAVNFV